MAWSYVYGAAGDDTERVRLRHVDEWARALTLGQLDSIGVQQGWRCADIGAGAGSVTRILAERVGPSGSVLATDIDCRFLLDLPSNVEVRCHDISQEDLESDAYDLVHCRLLLIHLKDPEAAAARMVAALKPGGWLVIEDADWGLCTIAGHPDAAWATTYLHLVSASHAEAGFRDPYIGRRLPGIFVGLQLDAVTGEAHAPVCRDGTSAMELHRLTVRGLRTASASVGASDTDFDRMIAALEHRSAIVTGVTLVAVRGQRPA